MTPDTVHRIAQDIRHVRALFTVEETWLQKQEPSANREEAFRRINFWRKALDAAEHQLRDTESVTWAERPVPAHPRAATASQRPPRI